MSDLHDVGAGPGAPSDDDLAADYVLGLLLPEDRSIAEPRLASDPVFADHVARWRQRMMDFDASAPEHPPSQSLWQRVDAGLGETRPVPAQRPAMFAGFWNNLVALRFATAGATAVAILCAGMSLFFYRTAASKPVFVAILVSDATRQAGAIVNTFADGHAELVPLVDIDVPSGRALQVWTLWDRAVGPRPVALIDRARSTRLDLDRLPTTASDQLFEITLEPAAGSPLGRPTGPILYKGTTARAL